MSSRTRRSAPRLTAWLLMGTLALGMSSCTYDNHLVFGATEKMAKSEIAVVPKWLGVLIISPFDAILAPWFQIYDQAARDPQYHPKHKYFSYSGSRVVGRADMHWGYELTASIFSYPIDTIYLLLTGPADLIWVLNEDEPDDDDGDDDDDGHDHD